MAHGHDIVREMERKKQGKNIKKPKSKRIAVLSETIVPTFQTVLSDKPFILLEIFVHIVQPGSHCSHMTIEDVKPDTVTKDMSF